MSKSVFAFCFLIVFLSQIVLQAQNKATAVATYSAPRMALGDVFVVTILVQNEKVKQVSSFPQIADFTKSTTTYAKDKKNYIIKQYYKPRKKGEFELGNYSLTINQKTHFFKGLKLFVTNAKATANTANIGPEVIYEEVKEHCQLNIQCSKIKLYQTESTLITVSLTVYDDNKAELNFIDLKDQLKAIAQLAKPSGVWSEDISSLKEISIDTTISKKNTTYILYRGYISPIDTGHHVIPSIPFRLLKYKIFKSALEIKRKETEIILHTLPLKIQTKPLPENLYGQWSAGQFLMKEKLNTNQFTVHKAFDITLTLSHLGLSGIIPAPIVLDNKNFNIFAPQVAEKMYRNGSSFIGTKSFQYTFVPKAVGTYHLADYFVWVYYNVATNTIDTLKPKSKITVEAGKEINLQVNETEEAKDWNEIINKSSNVVLHLESDPRLKWVSNVLIILMLLITLYIILKK